MFLIVCALLLLPALSSSAFTATSCLALWQLDQLSECHLKRSFGNYEMYGCACSGIDETRPIDGIDNCCATHSTCYNNLTAKDGPCIRPDTPAYCTYNWSCSKQEIECSHNTVCLQAVCECDKALMDCVGRYNFPVIPKKCPALNMVVRGERHLPEQESSENEQK